MNRQPANDDPERVVALIVHGSGRAVLLERVGAVNAAECDKTREALEQSLRALSLTADYVRLAYCTEK